MDVLRYTVRSVKDSDVLEVSPVTAQGSELSYPQVKEIRILGYNPDKNLNVIAAADETDPKHSINEAAIIDLSNSIAKSRLEKLLLNTTIVVTGSQLEDTNRIAGNVFLNDVDISNYFLEYEKTNPAH